MLELLLKKVERIKHIKKENMIGGVNLKLIIKMLK